MDDLTPSQRQAVEHRDGPLLVLAGPGSGKTRVITGRIARLVETGVDPRDVLAITFTNKAAREMAERVDRMLPGRRVWIATFHRFCARMLRRHAEAVGLSASYTIFDTTDQRQLVRTVLNQLDIDAVHYTPAKVAAEISRAKNDLVDPETYRRKFADSIGTHQQAVVARVYPAYQKALLDSNAVDFDDLLLHVVRLLQENDELRRAWDERFRYVLVDEYQDTNRAQYEIVKALSADHPNLCVTGDPDQSIYGWRGARLDNILRFERDFPRARVVRLEQNFRSTKGILRAADALIAHNRHRKIKSLLTDNDEGHAVELHVYRDATHEADAIAERIRHECETEGRPWSDVAILYRVNSLSRELELALTRHGIPYQVAAGVSFYDRAEVKDVLAYLRLVVNPADQVAFRRVVNTPKRGIGKTSQQRLLAWADAEGLTPIEAAARAAEVPNLPKRAASALKRFAGLLNDASLADAGSVEALLQTLLDRSGYARAFQEGNTEEELSRAANVDELLNAAHRYDVEAGEERTLEGFLESVSLASEVDSVDPDAGQVTLVTLHAAKGLEFPIVFVVAVEQNLLPHERSLRDGDAKQLEEERRLAFVGMTRAERRLILTCTARRDVRGRSLHTIPSDFLREIGDALTPHDFSKDDPWSSHDWGASAASPSRAKRSQPGAAGLDQPLLTTGAALLAGRREEATLPNGMAVGTQVRHPRYGRGTIVEVGGFSRHRTVTVEFDEDARRETFVADKSPLQPIGIR